MDAILTENSNAIPILNGCGLGWVFSKTKKKQNFLFDTRLAAFVDIPKIAGLYYVEKPPLKLDEFPCRGQAAIGENDRRIFHGKKRNKTVLNTGFAVFTIWRKALFKRKRFRK
ncbi:MAG: hypothetical protein V1777_01735 [Candidatus Micrarchaeota archaeon]